MIGWLLFFAALAAAGVARHRGWRGGSHSYFLAVFLVGTLAAALSSQLTLQLADQLPAPVPQLVFLAGTWSSLTAPWCVLSMLSFALAEPGAAPRRTLRHPVLLLVSGAAMGVLLAAIGPTSAVDFTGVYGRDWRAVLFSLVYNLYIVAAIVEFAVVIVRYLQTARPARQVVISLWLEMAGGALGLLWSTWGIARAVAAAYHAETFLDHPALVDLLASTCVGVMMVGAVWFVCARKAAEIWETWSLWRLKPLWSALRVVHPGLVLGIRSAPPGLRLQRYLIEISDWIYQVRVHAHRDIRAWVEELAEHRRLDAETTEAISTAVTIEAGLRGRAAGIVHPVAAASARRAGQRTSERPATQRVQVRTLLHVARLTGMGRWHARLWPDPHRRLVRGLSERAHASSMN
ncbi:DUF6545 domain-containing protein [Amycolatopsis sacchari]|uniref:DUF6545 domain-containing protein n=1 Tax=Amycolatopsis sacchari TaxID=115433 RepID=A0A1I3YQ66_9PSEU|nr:DUF6545 domain-containing protein [Amycolatopsis sacchari]SFK33935.1 hypothetical protein SAMN05421835_118120 [Amycolatopsis sacchari]